jgi:tetratricopeptide (TPR) repeat protein
VLTIPPDVEALVEPPTLRRAPVSPFKLGGPRTRRSRYGAVLIGMVCLVVTSALLANARFGDTQPSESKPAGGTGTDAAPGARTTEAPTLADAVRLLQDAESLYRIGRWARAEPLYRQALGIQEEVQGAESPDVSGTLNSLGILYDAWGRSAEAELAHRRALAINEKTLGLQHPRVATSLDHLGTALTKQGRFVEAEPLHRRALAIFEATYGPDGVDAAIVLNNLGVDRSAGPVCGR